MDDLLIGVDIGTTGTKAAIYDAVGSLMASSSSPTPLHWRGSDWCDQDPDDFYRGTTSAIRRCLAQSRLEPHAVQAIGISGQMAGVLGIDAQFQPSIPYDSWLDLRCSPDVEHLEQEIGDELVARTGCPAMVNHGPKMRWWRRECPAAYARTAKFVMPGGYVAGKLAAISADDAFIDRTYLHFTGVADTRAGSWSPDLTEEVGVALDKLPRIVEPSTIIGRLGVTGAADSGLPVGIPIVAGLGDTAAATLGAGIVRPNQLLDTAGTAAVFAVSTDDFRADGRERTVMVMRGAIEGQWISLSYLSGGSLLGWFHTAILQSEAAEPDLETLTAGIDTVPAGSAGLLFIPHLDGRVLPSNPSMRGAWVGLNRHHTQRHLVRSILESVAYEYAHFLQILLRLHPNLKPGETRVVGGGARSGPWNAIKASVLGVPYARLDRDELGCWGAALIAGHAVGIFPDLAAAAAAATRIRDWYQPDWEAHSRYRTMAECYVQTIEAIREPSRALAGIQAQG